MSNNIVVNNLPDITDVFPEDIPLELYLDIGGSEPLHTWRKRTFAEDLFNIHGEVVAHATKDKVTFTVKDIEQAVHDAMINVQYLIQGDGPTLAKYELRRVNANLIEKHNLPHLKSMMRPEEVNPEDYYALVNT